MCESETPTGIGFDGMAAIYAEKARHDPQVTIPERVQVDVTVINHGSIYVLHPQTPAGVEWVNENIGKDNGYQPQWPNVIVEPRYVGAIIEGMIADGLEVDA